MNGLYQLKVDLGMLNTVKHELASSFLAGGVQHTQVNCQLIE